MTVSTLTVVPEAHTSGTAPYVEPTPTQLAAFRPVTIREQMLHRVSQPDYSTWLHHVQGAAGCTHPVRLMGDVLTIEAGTGRLLSTVSTNDMPDGAIYKPCGNRRANVCPSCADVYRRDAYQIIRAGMVGGKGVDAAVSLHPAVFATFTAPGFGPVHTRPVPHHTCRNKHRCDCRPAPCRARRQEPPCPHGKPLTCFARHDTGDAQLGQPLCLDCYDHHAQVVWNTSAGELWRRTCIATTRAVRRIAKGHGVDPEAIKVAYSKVAEMQRRGVTHFHAIIRLDGAIPGDASTVLPPAVLGVMDLVDALTYAVQQTTFTTDPHPTRSGGWQIGWGAQFEPRPVAVSADGQITSDMVAAYLAKYATKSTEDAGHVSRRLTAETIDVYADADGTHAERLVDACWTLGGPTDWGHLRRRAHMLGFAGHFLTKSRRYSTLFRILREARVVWRRTEKPPTSDSVSPTHETTLVVNFLEFAGSGWHTNGDALLANSAAARAREYAHIAREEIAALDY